MKSNTIAAALLAAVPAAIAGKATVVNNCDSDVHLWTADTQRGQLGPHSLSANGGDWSEAYYMVGDGDSSDGGVSIKLTTDDDCDGAITQFEYTLSESGSPDLWYDISNVNCKGDSCPFYVGGFYLAAPIAVDCGPLTLLCDAVYNLFNDDKATHGTDSDEDLTLYLCGKDGSSSTTEVSTSYYSSTTAWTSYETISTPAYTPAATSTPAYSSTPVYTPSTMITATPSSAAPVVAAEVEASSEVEGEIVTEIVTEYATAVVTAWAHPAARSAIPHAHARRHEHHQHAGHPHWRK
ncbi:hypothetical protein K490DRAFT_53385 [Saccharata proteae CBS 121410]|uniref:Lytic polysaccharide monooxygenase n=1 Tax=Saccharata proteae CBS 121410 TaxID=1314787 RepID=A0A9P4M2F7_9PEZI|nr:hypothetical protein K490DRAFT_53385 [Saccharata proteae CBS 121410]